MSKVLRNTLAITLMLLTMGLVIGCSTVKPQQSAAPEGRQGMRTRQWDSEEMKKSLVGLVNDKIISQKQADSVIAYFEKRVQVRTKRPMGEQRGTNSNYEGQRPNNGQRPNQGQRPNPLSELVSNGTITQEQADKITEILFQPRSKN